MGVISKLLMRCANVLYGRESIWLSCGEQRLVAEGAHCIAMRLTPSKIKFAWLTKTQNPILCFSFRYWVLMRCMEMHRYCHNLRYYKCSTNYNIPGTTIISKQLLVFAAKLCSKCLIFLCTDTC